MPTRRISRQVSVPADCDGVRLDQAAARLFPEYSRSRLQTWIRGSALRVDGAVSRPRDKLLEGQILTLDVELEDESPWQAQAIGLDIVYEDDSLIVINKPAGLVVHPAAGHREGTLLNALLNHCPGVAAVPRAGIVHRLDKETSGLMVAAKTLEAHRDLVEQLQERSVHREYEAVVAGCMTGGGTVDAPLGRHPQQRKKRAVVQHGGKEAVTHYRLIRRFRDHSHIRCLLETGRTHQIRVHMAHIHHPLVGDPAYGGRPRLPKGASQALIDALQGFRRQALHAVRLELRHPDSGEPISWEVPLAADIQVLLAVLAAEEARR